MKYTVTIAETMYVVEVRGPDVTIDGRTVRASLDAGVGALRRVHLDGASSEVTVSPGEQPGSWIVAADGRRLSVAVVDERTRALRALKGTQAAAAHADIHAPMPGLIVRLLAREGDRVAAGAGVVVMEAMKMENQLKAPQDAVVRTIRVQPGDKVEKGAVLVELGPSEAAS